MRNRIPRRIEISLAFLACVLMSVGFNSVAFADEVVEWARYEIVGERNIFDPSRAPKMKTKPKPALKKKPPPKSLDLTGVIVQAKGSIAFFEGSAVNGSAMGNEGDKIAGLKIEAITTDGVSLLDGETTMTLKVGLGISKPSDGMWSAPGKLTKSSSSKSVEQDLKESGNSSGLSLLEMLKQRREKEN